MNQDLFNKFKITSLLASGCLVLWYFFDIDISKIQFIKDVGLDNQQIIAYVFVVLILFFSIEGILEFTKDRERSWQSHIQFILLVGLPICSIILAYPKIIVNSALEETSRLDLIIPLITSIIVSFIASILHFQITSSLVFFKFRKTLLPIQIISFIFLVFLLVLGIFANGLFSNNSRLEPLVFRNITFIIIFLISYIILSFKEPFFPQETLDALAKQSESMDRSVETYEHFKSAEKPLLKKKNKTYKQIMRFIQNNDEKEKKSMFPRFIMLEELSFKEEGNHFVPSNSRIQDEDFVLRVNFIQKQDGKIMKTEDVKYKYIKQACKEVSKIAVGNDIRSFLTPMATKAYYLHSFHEHDSNELLVNMAGHDENLSQLKELFKKRDPDVNFLAPNGWSALLIAVANGQEKTAKYLLQKAADPSISTKHGASPLHFASKYGKLSLCKLLIDYQADINQTDIDGSTPLMLAARYGHSSIVQYLIDNGATINHTNNVNKTAIDYATEGKFGEICRNLKKHVS